MDGNDQILQALADEAAEELRRIARGPGAEERLKDLVKKAAGRGTGQRDKISWPAGLLLLGLWEAGRHEEVRSYLDDWIRAGAPITRIDDALTGYVLLLCYEEKPEENYQRAADSMAAFFRKAPVDDAGSLIYQPTHAGGYVLADGAGQSAMFLSAYGKIFHDADASAMARAQILNFRHYGFDARTGLLYHGYNGKGEVKQGIIGWGRAAGWLLCGWAVVLSCGDDLRAGFRELAKTVLEYLRPDCLFSWQLEALEGPADTSATGMIGWALVRAGEAGVSFAGGESAPEKIAAALQRKIRDGRVYGSSAECIDFGQYPQQYGNNPWGQGAVLMFLAALRHQGHPE